jgi:hypothetical protein
VFELLLAVHLLFAIFAIGPLVHAATTAARAIRTGDATAAAASARMVRIYSYVSVLVVIVGFALMSLDSPRHKGEKVAKFSETWIWLSALLWLAAVAIALLVVVPALTAAGAVIARSEPARTLLPRVAAGGGAVGLIFAVIVFLMVYQPGG